MSAKDTGGAAFPEIETVPRDVGDNGNYTTIGDTYSFGGMTLRDYFADGANRSGACPCNQHDHKACAEWAFKRADAMLAARKEAQ